MRLDILGVWPKRELIQGDMREGQLPLTSSHQQLHTTRYPFLDYLANPLCLRISILAAAEFLPFLHLLHRVPLSFQTLNLAHRNVVG